MKRNLKFHLTLVHYDLSPVGFNDKVKVLFFPLQHEAAFLTLIVRHRPVENVPLALPSPRSRPRQLAVAGESWLWCDVASRTPQSLTYSPANRKPVNIVLLVITAFLVISSEYKACQAKQRTEHCKERNGTFWRTEAGVMSSARWPDRTELRNLDPRAETLDPFQWAVISHLGRRT